MMLTAERPVGENVEMAGRLFAVTKDTVTAASCRISAGGKCLKDVNQSLPYFVKLRLPGYSSASMIGSVESGESYENRHCCVAAGNRRICPGPASRSLRLQRCQL